jgi:hypothetical protein
MKFFKCKSTRIGRYDDDVDDDNDNDDEYPISY